MYNLVVLLKMNDIMNKIAERSIQETIHVIDALILMGALKVKSLFVFKGDLFLGLLTMGNIQRAIIKNHSLSSPISEVLEKDKIYASPLDSIEKIKDIMYHVGMECMPIVDAKRNLVDVLYWEDLFGIQKIPEREKIQLPVVIMAGGKGTRLKPITNIIPKPMVPIGNKTILEEILDQFEKIGCHKFYMSVNFKVDILKYYLDNLDHKYDLEFFQENKPLGTIGSVSMLKGKINTPFFVSNCDILIDQDFRDVYDYHIKNKNDLTIITALKNYKIPYGVIESGEDGLMTQLKEKPDITYMINTGVYILNPDLIDEIPEDTFFHITHLMERVKKNGGRVGCFPVGEDAWRDMGEWPEYLKMINVR